MFDFNKPKIEITEISDDKKYGRFVVELLYLVIKVLCCLQPFRMFAP